MTKRFRLSWNMRKIRRRIALVKEKMKVVEDYGRENSILSDSAPTYVKITESCISLIEPTPITENPKLLVLDSTESHAKQESKGASEGKGTKNIMSKIDTSGHKIPVSIFCVHYKSDPETVVHALWDCSRVKPVRRAFLELSSVQ
ncbi:hypothetical protein ACOSQ3_020636 [Xanthoceras sorbifolium]